MSSKYYLNPTKKIFSRDDPKLRRRLRPKRTLNHRLFNQSALKHPPIYDTERFSPPAISIKVHIFSFSRTSTSHHTNLLALRGGVMGPANPAQQGTSLYCSSPMNVLAFMTNSYACPSIHYSPSIPTYCRCHSKEGRAICGV
jgi:hypothetical protein